MFDDTKKKEEGEGKNALSYLDRVKQTIYHKIQHNQAILKGVLKEGEQEEEEEMSEDKKKEQEKKDEQLADNVEEFLKKLGLEATIPKLEEHDIGSPEIFFGLSEDEMITYLEIKTEGAKYRFKK